MVGQGVGEGIDRARCPDNQGPTQNNDAQEIVPVEAPYADATVFSQRAERKTSHERRVENRAGDQCDDEAQSHHA